MQVRNVLAGFGVAISFRAIGAWVKDAIQVQNLTAQQAKDLRETRTAMAGLNLEFQNLARTAATELAPAIEHAAKWWREFLFPTDAETAQDRLGELSEKALTLSRTLVDLQQRDPFINPEAIARVRAEIEGLQKEMGVLQGVVDKPLKPGNLLDGLSEISGELARMPADFRKDFDAAAAAAAVLNSELKEISGSLVKMPDDFKKLSPEFNTFAANLAASLKPAQDEATELQKSLGRGLRDSAVDAMMGIEVSFKDMLRRMAIEAAVSGLFDIISGGLASSTGSVGKFFGKMFGGSRASTGSVRGGMMYKVHEGEAFFAPGKDGHVGKTGGQSGPVFNFNAPIYADDAIGVKRAVAEAYMQSVATSDARVEAKLNAYDRPRMA